MTADPLRFFATPPHACSYLSDRDAVTVYVDPESPKDKNVYSNLSRHGFRRSGEQIYVPQCTNCSACVPVRIPVGDFVARRAHNRTAKRNSDLDVAVRPAQFDPEHFALYERYIKARHAGGGMDNPTPDEYLQFLTSSWCDTRFIEFRAEGRLLAVAVTDVLLDGLSAVYTFFDPAAARRGLGVYAVLWQIEEAKRRQLDWLYLGYWVAGSPKMNYKVEYQPQQHLREGRWVPTTG
ncbi:MAG: arginyltransferase [Gammaproteobacteria bacterium]|nr:arginyltransferase [Gammaproteobacteria bacterium]